MATDMSGTWNLCVIKSTKKLPSFSKKPVMPKNKALLGIVSTGYDVVLTTGSVPSSKTKRRRVFLMEESSGKIVGMEFTDSAGAVIFHNIETGLYKIIVDGNDLPDGDGGNFETVTYDKVSVP